MENNCYKIKFYETNYDIEGKSDIKKFSLLKVNCNLITLKYFKDSNVDL